MNIDPPFFSLLGNSFTNPLSIKKKTESHTNIMHTESEAWSRRDSWPPTQVRLKPTVPTKNDPLPSLEDIDENPLTYFLTPAPDLDDDDAMDTHMMDFDAGIEDSNKPREIVRSVSPSTLDGLRKANKARPASPDTESEVSTPMDEDDDDEDYVRFSPSSNSLLTLEDLTASHTHRRRHHSPLLAPGPHSRGRSRGRARRSGHVRVASSSSVQWGRPGHLWREPSPDVWSIEEETEEELMSEVGSSVAAKSEDEGDKIDKMKAAKPMKKVRFVLPPREV